MKPLGVSVVSFVDSEEMTLSKYYPYQQLIVFLKIKPAGKFNWKGNIKAVLKDAPEQELAVKKLRKKVSEA